MPLTISPGQLIRRAHFYRQFAQLTAAGIKVVNALEILKKNPPARSFREPIRRMLQHIAAGGTFSDAMRQQGHWIPGFDIALIQAGEQSGRLDAICRLLANYYEDRARLLRQMLIELGYPLFLLHFALFLFATISLFQGGTGSGFLLRTFGVLVPMYALTFIFIYAAQGRHGNAWRSMFETLLRPVPMLGTARHYLALSRLASALEALITAGVTIIEAWEMAAAACASPALHRAVMAWKPRLLDGQTPAEAVQNCRLFPEHFANMYYSGEVSGQLDESLRGLSAHYLEEGSRKMHILAQWVPRGIYLMVALFIGYRVIHFYMDRINEWNNI